MSDPVADQSTPAEYSPRIKDAAKTNWVDRYLPNAVKPYAKLARWDRPIGIWLLVIPGWWGIAMGYPQALRQWPDSWLLLLFALGAIAMRGAGCTFNDIVDRDFDAQVERTAQRPLPSGQVSLRAAWTFLIAQCLVGFFVLIQLNLLAILLGIASLGLVAIYPFMKRITWWPQAWLGLTFNWGVLMGWAAAAGVLEVGALWLYAGAILWTLGYDTIYAHQDKEDDALIGVKSTARRFGYQTHPWLIAIYGLALVFWWQAGAAAQMNAAYFIGLFAVAAHFGWQIWRLEVDRGALCLRLFKSNRDAGLILLGAIVLGGL